MAPLARTSGKGKGDVDGDGTGDGQNDGDGTGEIDGDGNGEGEGKSEGDGNGVGRIEGEGKGSPTWSTVRGASGFRTERRVEGTLGGAIGCGS
ncbi:MAG TPA: hypothetical protein VMZ30_18465 [Pyrinomonadaceae bacterium]|nr:hypothetical protein [Pyrinomonadaceae bacterium]